MKILKYYLQIILLMDANAMLHYISRIPFIGDALTRRSFDKRKTKTFFSFLGFLYGLLNEVLGKFIVYFVALDWLPRFVLRRSMEGTEGTQIQVTLFLLLFCLLPFLGGSSIFSVTKEDRIFLHHFTLDPNIYYKAKVGIGTWTTFFMSLPGLYFVFRDVRWVVYLMVIKLCSAYLTHGIYLFQFQKNIPFVPKVARQILNFSLYIGVYVLLRKGLLPLFPMEGKTAMVVALVLGLLGIVSMTYVFLYQGYKKIAVKYANMGVAQIKVTLASDAFISEGDEGLKHCTEENNRRFYEKHGHLSPEGYVGKAFQHRFHSILRNTILQGILTTTFFSIIFGLCIRYDLFSLEDDPINYTSKLIFLIFSLPMSMKYLSLYFRNVDRVFLSQRLYGKKDIQKTMIQRMLFLFQISIPILFGFWLNLLLLTWIGNISLPWDAWPPIMVAFALIYYVYELFMILSYYGLQPYSTELVVKSPLFRLLQFLFGIFGIYFLFTESNVTRLIPGLWMSLGILSISTIILWCFVDRTFKLRY
ncbi:MAG: hypothetical protein Q4Q17_02560 [Tissierellia bacterium]|nr:hypothetical protein [Tissierellia bacterium]